MTPDQITKYFENTEDHPKYKQIDTNTKFFYDNLIKKVKRHKIGKGDRGMKTVEEICLPKPKKELKYFTSTTAPAIIYYYLFCLTFPLYYLKLIRCNTYI